MPNETSILNNHKGASFVLVILAVAVIAFAYRLGTVRVQARESIGQSTILLQTVREANRSAVLLLGKLLKLGTLRMNISALTFAEGSLKSSSKLWSVSSDGRFVVLFCDPRYMNLEEIYQYFSGVRQRGDACLKKLATVITLVDREEGRYMIGSVRTMSNPATPHEFIRVSLEN